MRKDADSGLAADLVCFLATHRFHLRPAGSATLTSCSRHPSEVSTACLARRPGDGEPSTTGHRLWFVFRALAGKSAADFSFSRGRSIGADSVLTCRLTRSDLTDGRSHDRRRGGTGRALMTHSWPCESGTSARHGLAGDHVRQIGDFRKSDVIGWQAMSEIAASKRSDQVLDTHVMRRQPLVLSENPSAADRCIVKNSSEHARPGWRVTCRQK